LSEFILSSAPDLQRAACALLADVLGAPAGASHSPFRSSRVHRGVADMLGAPTGASH